MLSHCIRLHASSAGLSALAARNRLPCCRRWPGRACQPAPLAAVACLRWRCCRPDVSNLQQNTRASVRFTSVCAQVDCLSLGRRRTETFLIHETMRAHQCASAFRVQNAKRAALESYQHANMLTDMHGARRVVGAHDSPGHGTGCGLNMRCRLVQRGLMPIGGSRSTTLSTRCSKIFPPLPAACTQSNNSHYDIEMTMFRSSSTIHKQASKQC